MAVEEHPVHEKTRQGSDFKYGCQHRVMKPGYWAKDGFIIDPETGLGQQKYKWIAHDEDQLSTKCRNFFLWNPDIMGASGCVGCTTERDYAYRDRMIALGKL